MKKKSNATTRQDRGEERRPVAPAHRDDDDRRGGRPSRRRRAARSPKQYQRLRCARRHGDRRRGRAGSPRARAAADAASRDAGGRARRRALAGDDVDVDVVGSSRTISSRNDGRKPVAPARRASACRRRSSSRCACARSARPPRRFGGRCRVTVSAPRLCARRMFLGEPLAGRRPTGAATPASRRRRATRSAWRLVAIRRAPRTRRAEAGLGLTHTRTRSAACATCGRCRAPSW